MTNINNNHLTNSKSDISSLMDFDAFICRAEGQSEKTIEFNNLAIGKLSQYLADNELPTDLREIGSREIRGFILCLTTAKRFSDHPYVNQQENCLSDHSVNSYLRTVRAACNRWVSEGLLEKSPFQGVKLPRLSEKVTPPLSAEQLNALHHSVDYFSPQGPRDAALLAVLTDTISRVSEISSLETANLNLQSRHIKVYGKGRRERVIPFGTKTQKLIYKYVHFYRPSPSDPREDFVFLTHDGRPLTRNRIYAIVRKYAKKAGIDGIPCSPHSLRRSGCVRWIVNGRDIYSLQKMTGHKSLTVLKTYVDLSQADVKALHEKYSPMDNL